MTDKTPKTVQQILIDENYITTDDSKQAKEYADQNGVSELDALIALNIISKDLIGQALAEYFKSEYINISAHEPSRELAQKVPESIAKKFRIILFEEDEKQLKIATDDPSQNIIAQINDLAAGREVKIYFALPEDIDSTLLLYKQPLQSRIERVIQDEQEPASLILQEIFADALSMDASDIHFEPHETYVRVRFRLDGVLKEACRLEKEVYEKIINRIKVRAKLKIDDHFSAQDGAIRYSEGDIAADMRISILPALDGEKIVIRLLSQYVHSLSLNDLGLSPQHQKMLEKAGKKPFGMIIVSGPTGSGKTSTLYALLKSLEKTDINITTIEDPVEYKLMDVNQIQVNKDTNLTFAQGLHTIVRQDPDIILVGEIRDQETAEIAINAALTGHLLLSTVHANDAATVVPRFLDMGIEPFLLASTLELIISQRLVRKICQSCRYSFHPTADDIAAIDPKIQKFFNPEMNLYKGKGCNSCSNTGFKGRTAIFEFIEVNSEIRNLILKNPSAQQIAIMVKKHGSPSLFEDGINKIKNGITTIEELLRVVEIPSDLLSE